MDIDIELDRLYREEWGRILATVIRMVGSFDLAEEAVQEAFAAALEQWPRDGLPANQRAWMVSTARNKAIDHLRRAKRLEDKAEELEYLSAGMYQEEPNLVSSMTDDRLSLIFTCCHPSIALESQVALTLRTLCGLTTEAIAHAFLLPVATMAQRLVRTKRKIQDANIPYRVPGREEFGQRLEAVLLVIYLVFNEGYSASFGDALVRHELCGEAIRLGRILVELLPRDPEVRALLALMLLHDSRRGARTASDGSLITLEEQDRNLWNRDQISEGLQLLESALRSGPAGVYALQASIAGLHAQAANPEETDWPQIEALYRILLRLQPSPVVALNHAASVGMAGNLTEGLRLLEALEADGELQGYYLLPAAKADLLRRAGEFDRAAHAYRAALGLVKTGPEKDYLLRRLKTVAAEATNS